MSRDLLVSTKMTVKNVPDHAEEYAYWVVTPVDGTLWFYGAYESREKANEVTSTAQIMRFVINVNEGDLKYES